MAGARVVHQPQAIEGTPYLVPAQAIDHTTFDRWLSSRAHRDISGFVVTLAESVAGIDDTSVPTDAKLLSPTLRGMVSMLDVLEEHIAEVPPAKQQMRYGNTAFRTWHAWLETYLTDGALARHGVLSGDALGAAAELSPYLLESCGNPTRLDYGTGHELAFVCFLFCLAKLKLVAVPTSTEQRAAAAQADTPTSAPAAEPAADERVVLVLVVFRRYITLMRSLQRTYRLEPAGSHGVWGLDDYCFLPFLFGASQLVLPTTDPCAAAVPPPDSINDPAARAELASRRNLFMEAVEFVCSVKGPLLAEHSPMLYDISGLASWKRVASGLVRMYYAEVLGKRPVVGLLVFGSLIPWEAGPRGVGEH